MYPELGASGRVRGVLFDLVGTLIRPRASVGEQYALQARRFGARTADAARLDEAFRSAMLAAPSMAFPGLDASRISAEERRWWHALVSRVMARTGLADQLGSRFEEFFDALYDHFATAEAWVAYPDARPALERLRGEGLVVGLVTNYDTRVHQVLGATGLAALVDSVTIPALAGAAKPDCAIFRHALALLRLSPGEAVHVGDEVDDDCVGASRAGLLAILLDRHDSHPDAGFRRIRSLDEL